MNRFKLTYKGKVYLYLVRPHKEPLVVDTTGRKVEDSDILSAVKVNIQTLYQDLYI